MSKILEKFRLYFIASPIIVIYTMYYSFKNGERFSTLIRLYGTETAVDILLGEMDGFIDKLCDMLKL